LSEKLEELELNFVDADLEVLNPVRELKEQIGENDIDILRKVKEMQAQLERFKGVRNSSIRSEAWVA
jgi:hypothetical protein